MGYNIVTMYASGGSGETRKSRVFGDLVVVLVRGPGGGMGGGLGTLVSTDAIQPPFGGYDHHGDRLGILSDVSRPRVRDP